MRNWSRLRSQYEEVALVPLLADDSAHVVDNVEIQLSTDIFVSVLRIPCNQDAML